MKTVTHIIIVQILLIKFTNTQTDPLEYSITVPKNFCSKSSDGTIRIEGNDAEKLQYEWNLKFTKYNNCKNQQRCNLIAWDSVRSIQKLIKSQNKTQSILLNNATMIPGLEYLLEVTVSDSGKIMEKKTFTFECSNSSEEAESAQLVEHRQLLPMSLKLVGSNVTYRDLTYMLTAIVANCYENCNFYYKWELLDELQNPILSYNVKGSELKVLPNTFKVANSYVVKCSIIYDSTNAIIDIATQTVKVLPRPVILKISVATLLVGQNKPFKLNAYLKDVNNFGYQTDIKWACTVNDGNCESFTTVNSTVLEHPGFSGIDEYNITITVTKGNLIKMASCTVKTVNEGFAKIDVDSTGDSVDPSKRIEILAYVSGLVTKCALEWTSVEAENYENVKNNVGNLNKPLNVTLTEDEFLSEIDEFSNKDMDLNYNLNLPAPESWSGILANSTYLFRLNVTCPYTHEEDDGNESSESLIIEKYVSLYADVEVKTARLPILYSLNVVPTKGIALKTLFNFNVVQENVSYDRPILYKFGYFINDELITHDLMDSPNSSAVLPYSDHGVKTIVIGCNNELKCSQVYGPIITTNFPEVTESEQANLMEKLQHLIKNEEYYNAFAFSISILETYKSLHDNHLLKNMGDFISNTTSHEIKRLLMMKADGDKKWNQPAGDLLKNVGLLLNGYSTSPILLNNVVALRDELSRSTNLKMVKEREELYYSGRKLLEDTRSRVKRSVELFTLEEVKSFLMISEIVITTSTDPRKVELEKQHFLKQINKYMQGLCASLYEQPQSMNIELKNLLLSIEKIDTSSNSKYYHILNYENSWKLNGRIKLGQCVAKKTQNEKLCLGKLALKNYFNKKGITHMAKVYSADEDDSNQDDLRCDYILVLPLNTAIKNKKAKCALWRNRWTQSLCHTANSSNKTIQCVCKRMGFYTLEYVAKILTTEPPLKLTTTLRLTVSPTENTKQLTTSTAADLPLISEINTDVEMITNDPNLTEMISIDNSTSSDIQDGDELTLYFVIGFSIIGVGIIIFAIRRLISEEDELQSTDGPVYARLHDEHMLEDVPIL